MEKLERERKNWGERKREKIQGESEGENVWKRNKDRVKQGNELKSKGREKTVVLA